MRKLSLYLKVLGMFSLFLLLVACATRTTPAPILNITQAPNYVKSPASPPVATSAKQQQSSTPAPKLGALSNDNEVIESTAQPITITQPRPKPTNTAASTTIVAVPVSSASNVWIMPASGTIVQRFTPTTKGINIRGYEGQPIYAINNGRVVYSGNGLKGYGNLIIIKHDSTYLSAYAHNKTNLVQEGAIVKRGQKIGQIGLGDDGKPTLHLELRKNGKPIDPLSMISQ